MAIGVIDGPRGFAQVMEMTELVRGLGKAADGLATSVLAVTDDCQDWTFRACLTWCKRTLQIVLRGGQQTLGQQDFAGETVA